MESVELSRKYGVFPPEKEDRQDSSRWICDFSGLIGFAPDFLGACDDTRPEKRVPFYSRLCDTFINYNADIFDRYNITVKTYFDRREVLFAMETHDIIGAFPLRSPTSGMWKHFMLIHPRQGWDAFGVMLSSMGMKQVPTLEPLPIYPQSSRDIPAWVIASIVISRLEDLFKDMARRFHSAREYLSTPKGRVDWSEYITKQLPRMRDLEIPCDVSIIQDQKELKSYIRFTLKRLEESLLNARSAAPVVQHLLARIGRLMLLVSDVMPVRPPVGGLNPVLFGKATPTMRFKDGLQAIEWTNEERGFAGDNEFSGMAWRLNVNDFFEAYVETVAEHVALLTGGVLKVGRRYQTSIEINWENDPGIAQRHLRPDFIIERDDETIILDAKYKGYWHQLDIHMWSRGASQRMEIARDSFRDDILQVLAYSTCFSTDKIKVCLVYPCSKAEYDSLTESGKLHQKAFVGDRNIEVVRTLIPMTGDVELPAHELANYLLSDAT